MLICASLATVGVTYAYALMFGNSQFSSLVRDGRQCLGGSRENYTAVEKSSQNVEVQFLVIPWSSYVPDHFMSQDSSEYKKDGCFSVTNNCCMLVHSALSKPHAKLLSSPALLEHDCW